MCCALFNDAIISSDCRFNVTHDEMISPYLVDKMLSDAFVDQFMVLFDEIKEENKRLRI
jgi:hypothetical protein